MTQATYAGNNLEIDPQTYTSLEFPDTTSSEDLIMPGLISPAELEFAVPHDSENFAPSNDILEQFRTVSDVADFAVKVNIVLDPNVASALSSEYDDPKGAPLFSSALGGQLGRTMLFLAGKYPENYTDATSAWAKGLPDFMTDSNIDMSIKKLFVGGTLGVARNELRNRSLQRTIVRTPRKDAARYIAGIIKA